MLTIGKPIIRQTWHKYGGIGGQARLAGINDLNPMRVDPNSALFVFTIGWDVGKLNLPTCSGGDVVPIKLHDTNVAAINHRALTMHMCQCLHDGGLVTIQMPFIDGSVDSELCAYVLEVPGLSGFKVADISIQDRLGAVDKAWSIQSGHSVEADDLMFVMSAHTASLPSKVTELNLDSDWKLLARHEDGAQLMPNQVGYRFANHGGRNMAVFATSDTSKNGDFTIMTTMRKELESDDVVHDEAADDGIDQEMPVDPVKTRTFLHVKVGTDDWHPTDAYIDAVKKKFEDAKVVDVVIATDSRVSIEVHTIYKD